MYQLTCKTCPKEKIQQFLATVSSSDKSWKTMFFPVSRAIAHNLRRCANSIRISLSELDTELEKQENLLIIKHLLRSRISTSKFTRGAPEWPREIREKRKNIENQLVTRYYSNKVIKKLLYFPLFIRTLRWVSHGFPWDMAIH